MPIVITAAYRVLSCVNNGSGCLVKAADEKAQLRVQVYVGSRNGKVIDIFVQVTVLTLLSLLTLLS